MIGTDDGIIYDDTVWEITVKITAVEMENGDIRLRASVTDLRANDETCSISTIPTFYNETKPPVDPEDPPVDPKDPPVDPEDPPVDPEDPPVDPEDPIDIPDEDVPRVDVPQTGDLSILWMAISGVAAAGLIGLGATRKKKDEA